MNLDGCCPSHLRACSKKSAVDVTLDPYQPTLVFSIHASAFGSMPIPPSLNEPAHADYEAEDKPKTIWGCYWSLVKPFDNDLEKDWNSDLDVLLIVVSDATSASWVFASDCFDNLT